jgi:hypothetical protein
MIERCQAYENQQCRATKDLTHCVLRIEQGKLLKGPERVVVPLCPKHFNLLIERKAEQ